MFTYHYMHKKMEWEKGKEKAKQAIFALGWP